MTAVPLTDLTAIPDGSHLTITGRITAVDERNSHQNTPWAVITLATDNGDMDIEVLPRNYLRHHDLLAVGADVTADVRVSQYGGAPTIVAFRIHAADGGR